MTERAVCAEGNVHFLEKELFIGSCTSVAMNSHIAEVLLLYTAVVLSYMELENVNTSTLSLV